MKNEVNNSRKFFFDFLCDDKLSEICFVCAKVTQEKLVPVGDLDFNSCITRVNILAKTPIFPHNIFQVLPC